MTIDLKEIIGIAGAYVLAGIFCMVGEYAYASLLAGTVSGYAFGRSS